MPLLHFIINLHRMEGIQLPKHFLIWCNTPTTLTFSQCNSSTHSKEWEFLPLFPSYTRRIRNTYSSIFNLLSSQYPPRYTIREQRSSLELNEFTMDRHFMERNVSVLKRRACIHCHNGESQFSSGEGGISWGFGSNSLFFLVSSLWKVKQAREIQHSVTHV